MGPSGHPGAHSPLPPSGSRIRRSTPTRSRDRPGRARAARWIARGHFTPEVSHAEAEDAVRRTGRSQESIAHAESKRGDPPHFVGWQRFRRLTARGKQANIACTAIARELLAFMWAIAKEVPLHA